MIADGINYGERNNSRRIAKETCIEPRNAQRGREKANLKHQAAMADLQRKAADDQKKMQEKIYALQAKIRKEDKDYVVKEHDSFVRGQKVLLDSELEQTKLEHENMNELQETQNTLREGLNAE